jgi:myo-inositol 2-dehydrogenase / D-chiro-inositol 1-dehydrogenase
MRQESDRTGSDVALSRRDFVKHSAVAAASVTVGSALNSRLYAAGSDELKVGLIGCGGRGTGAVTQALMATKTPVKLWAMADLFRDKLDKSYDMLHDGAAARYDRVAFDGLASQMDVPESRKFVGFDAYKQLLATDVDMVILTTPPGFRPMTFKAAVAAGKHVFLEKPVAVDPVGIRTIIAAAKVAKEKGLSVVAGTQRRHQDHYIEIMKRVGDGAIGEIRAAQVYWNGSGGSLRREQPADMSDMEFQVRNWYSFCWICGDHIVEQHVHNIDIMHWAMQGPPEFVMGMGGRETRRGGNIWDHFAVEFEYPGGVRVLSMCRHHRGCTDRVSEHLVGTKGIAYIDSSTGWIKGETNYEPPASSNPYVQEHADLIASIREGKAVNEGVQVAESTMAAIAGRMSAYTGRALKWDWVMKASKLDLSPAKYEFGDLPVRPVPVPGQTPLI